MKTNYFISALVLVVLSFQSCNQDDLSLTSNDPGNQGVDLKSKKSGYDIYPMGDIPLSREEYDALPKANLDEIKALPGFEMSQRRSINSALLKTPPVMDQGGEGSCNACSFGYCAGSYITAVKNKWSLTSWKTSTELSPEYLFNKAKIPGPCDTGSFASDILDVMMTGVPTWYYMPYSDSNGCSALSPTYTPIGAASTKYKISKWYVLPIVSKLFSALMVSDIIIGLLNKGFPICAAFNVDDNFYSQTYTSPFKYNSTGGTVYGSHRVTIIGYNNLTKCFKIQNSWGTSRHDKGYFYVPYTNVGIFTSLYSME